MALGGGGRRMKATPTPNLTADPNGTRLLNLTVLRRLDPAVEDILITAAHVTTYSFDVDEYQWGRKGVEGSLFVVKRNSQPRFQFVVMNRRNTENLVEDLLSGFDYEVQVPYIMYCNATGEVTGIWFYDPQECEEVGRLFDRIHKTFSRVSPKAVVSASNSGFEEPEVASAAPSAEATLGQPALFTGTARIGANMVGTCAVQPNSSVCSAPSSSHASSSSVSAQPPALYSLFPSRTSSASAMPTDVHMSSSAPTIQPASLLQPSLLYPVTSSQRTVTPAAYSSFPTPPLHIPLTIQRRQSVPLPQPFTVPAAPRPPPYGAPLLQPFPPPNPSPLLAPTASYGPVITRDTVRAAFLRLVQNDEFIDMLHREILKGL